MPADRSLPPIVFALVGLLESLSVARLPGAPASPAHLLLGRPCHSVVLVGTSIGRAGGAGRTSPCRGVGQRPTSLQSQLLSILLNRRAPARPKSASICVTEGLPSEVTEQSAFPALCVLCDFQSFWQSFVHLRGPSCIFVSAPQGKPSTVPPTTPPVAPQGRSLFSVAVEGLALWACTLRSLFSGAAQPPLPACTAHRIALIYRNIRQFNQRNTHGKRQVLQRQAASA